MKKTITRFSLTSFILGIVAGSLVTTATGAGTLGSFTFRDVPQGAYYDGAIGEMQGLGIITGFGDGTFKPDEPLTRGQAAVLLQRLRNDVLGIEPQVTFSSSSRSSRSRTRVTSSSSSSSSISSSVSSVSSNPAGLLRFTTSKFSADEDKVAKLTVVRTGWKSGLASVQYRTKAGSAEEGVDYEKTEGTLNFAANETTKTIEISLIDDANQEGDENFTVELYDVAGGAGFSSPTEAELVIEDDETGSGGSSTTTNGSSTSDNGVFIFSALEYSVDEQGGTATIRVLRTEGSVGTVTVNYTISDETAQSGKHYQKVNGSLAFNTGETEKTFTISIEDNSNIEGNKTVLLTLTAPAGGAVLGDRKQAILTIFDDEVVTYGNGMFRFSTGNYEVEEEDKFAVITVNRISGAKG